MPITKNKIERTKIKKFKKTKIKTFKAHSICSEKIIDTRNNMDKERKLKILRFWMRIIASVICVVIFMSALYFLFVVGNDTLDFSLTELISTDTEVIVSAENKPEKEDSAKINERLITVVNSNNRIDSGFTPKLYEYDGVFISKDMLSDLEEMMTEAEKNGLNLKITKGYVSYEEQQKTYEDTINYFENEMGYSSVKSEEYAMKTTPDGESCEYRTGLLISFDSGNENFEKTSEYIWLYNNCVKYGFVLRYPEKKENYTGYEPIYNTFRYVGKENAKRMRMLDMSLEEYRNYIDNQSTSI